MNITTNLPNELISKAAEYLTSKERCAARSSCKSFNQNLRSFYQKDIPYIDAELIKKLNQRLVECLGKRFLSTVPCIGLPLEETAPKTSLAAAGFKKMEQEKFPICIVKYVLYGENIYNIFLRLTNLSAEYPKLTELAFSPNEKYHLQGQLISKNVKTFNDEGEGLENAGDIFDYVKRLAKLEPCGNFYVKDIDYGAPEPRLWYFMEDPKTERYSFLWLKKRSIVSLANE